MTIIDLDARKAQRRRVLDTGLIRFDDMSISCAIRNVSNGGLALGWVAGRHSGSVHIVCRRGKENLFVQRRLA
jgi:hypothetical protein